jgi:hypothetical protein
MIERARADIRAELAAQRYPEAEPVPMAEHLAALPPAPATEAELDYQDFDCRR